MNTCQTTYPRELPEGKWVWIPINEFMVDGNSSTTLKWEPPSGEGLYEFGDLYFDGISGDGDGDGDGDVDDCFVAEVKRNDTIVFPYRVGSQAAYIGADASGGDNPEGYRVSELTLEASHAFGCCEGYRRGNPVGRALQLVDPIKHDETVSIKVTCGGDIGSTFKGGALKVRKLTAAEAARVKAHGGRRPHTPAA